jgi:hypothetical protein
MVRRHLFQRAGAIGIGVLLLCLEGCGLEEPEPGGPPTPGGDTTDKGNATLPELGLDGTLASTAEPAQLEPVGEPDDQGTQGTTSPCDRPRPPHGPALTRPGDRLARTSLQPACRDEAAQSSPLRTPLRPGDTIAPSPHR